MSVSGTLPDRLVFPALGELWWLEYQSTSTRGSAQTRVKSQSASLRVSGDLSDTAACYRSLQRFILRHAREQLPIVAAELSEQCASRLSGRQPASIVVMNAKRRWGSCSSDGHIRLNCKLLFFPPDQAQQVILHELAHLCQMNHSKRFYQLLYSLPGASQNAEKANRKALCHIPEWFLFT